MKDGSTGNKVLEGDAQCASCKRRIESGELYGAHGFCSSCLEDGLGEHHGA